MIGIRNNIRSMAGYVPGEQPRGDDIIKLNTNENPYPPSPRVFAAIQEQLVGDRLRKYPDPTGQRFRKIAGELFQVDPDAILIGNGSDDILTILTRAFVPEHGRIVSLSPSYILYRSLAEIQNAVFETVPFTSDWQVPNPWPSRGANLTFLANPNSPSGTLLSNAAIDRLLNQLDSPLVLDEAYADFAPENGLAFARQGRLIISRSLSKSYALAGIRFGFAIAEPAIIRELLKVKDSYNCDTLSLAAACAALEDQEYLASILRKIQATRARLTEALLARGFEVTPSQANFVWARRTDRPHKPIYEALKSRGVLIRYMNYTGYGDGLRISIGTDAEINRFLKILDEILAIE